MIRERERDKKIWWSLTNQEDPQSPKPHHRYAWAPPPSGQASPDKAPPAVLWTRRGKRSHNPPPPWYAYRRSRRSRRPSPGATPAAPRRRMRTSQSIAWGVSWGRRRWWWSRWGLGRRGRRRWRWRWRRRSPPWSPPGPWCRRWGLWGPISVKLRRACSKGCFCMFSGLGFGRPLLMFPKRLLMIQDRGETTPNSSYPFQICLKFQIFFAFLNGRERERIMNTLKGTLYSFSIVEREQWIRLVFLFPSNGRENKENTWALTEIVLTNQYLNIFYITINDVI